MNMPLDRIWTRQPQVAVRVNRANPITKNIRVAFFRGVNWVNGEVASATGVVPTVTTQGGIAHGPVASTGNYLKIKSNFEVQATSLLNGKMSALMLGTGASANSGCLGKTNGSGAGFSITGPSSAIYTDQYYIASNRMSFGNYNTGLLRASGLNCAAFRSDTTNVGMFFNGQKNTAASNIGSTSDWDPTFTEITIGSGLALSTYNSADNIVLFCLWERDLSDTELASVTANPWQLFAPINRPIFVGLVSTSVSSITLTVAGDSSAQASATAVINTGVYTSVDGTKTGWIGSPDNTNLYTNINEVTSSNTEYIQSPVINGSQGPIEFTLNNSLAAGNWEIDATAKYTVSTAQVKFTLLDSGGTSVGTTGWITITSTFAGYTPTITSTGTATKIRIEIQ